MTVFDGQQQSSETTTCFSFYLLCTYFSFIVKFFYFFHHQKLTTTSITFFFFYYYLYFRLLLNGVVVVVVRLHIDISGRRSYFRLFLLTAGPTHTALCIRFIDPRVVIVSRPAGFLSIIFVQYWSAEKMELSLIIFYLPEIKFKKRPAFCWVVPRGHFVIGIKVDLIMKFVILYLKWTFLI